MHSQTSNFSFRPIKWIYFINEVHPIFPNIAFSYLNFTALYLFAANFLKIGIFSWLDLIIGSSTYAALLLSLRAFDELKDQDTDIINFPNRPLVTGVVARSDLNTLTALIFAGLLTIHFAVFQLAPPTLVFVSLSLLSFLTYKWFYLESFVKPRITLTFLTHNPLVYVLKIYIISFLLGSASDITGQTPILAVLCFALSETAWEISRKIKQKREETEYKTYSKAWGRGFSTKFTLITLYASSAIFTFLVYTQLKSIGAEQNKIYLAITSIPFLSLLYVSFQVNEFLNGNLKGEGFRKKVETQIGALIVSALLLGSSVYFL